jgi:hypothetical protein
MSEPILTRVGVILDGDNMSEPILTRVGVILDGDNRFLGRSTFHGWVHALTAASDATLVALGVEVTAEAREAARIVTIAGLSPDARVWPLKLTRLLASYGDPLAGYFGAQLVSAGNVMGPGAVTMAAHGLEWVREHAGDDGTDAQVKDAVASWCARSNGRFAGFGVPFRDVDERRVAVLQLVGDGPLARLPFWRVHERIVKVMAPLRPNVAISFAAMLLDIGVAADHGGIALSMLMSPNFLAHALEAAAQDGARVNALPASCISYRGMAPRSTTDPTRAETSSHPGIPGPLRRTTSPNDGVSVISPTP